MSFNISASYNLNGTVKDSNGDQIGTLFSQINSGITSTAIQLNITNRNLVAGNEELIKSNLSDFVSAALDKIESETVAQPTDVNATVTDGTVNVSAG